MADEDTRKEALGRWLSGLSDDAVLRWLLRGMIAATVIVVALDYEEMHNRFAARTQQVDVPIMQPAPEHVRPQDGTPTLLPKAPNARLRDRMTFELATMADFWRLARSRPELLVPSQRKSTSADRT
jgi:hypothetical protein